MKKLLYSTALVFLAALCAFVFSFVNVDKFVFYTFFAFIGAYLCGIKQTPVILAFLVLDMILLKTDIVHILELGLFYVLLSLFSRKMGVYVSAVLSVLICFTSGALCSKEIFDAIEKLPCYILTLAFAPPFVFALMRGRVIKRSKLW